MQYRQPKMYAVIKLSMFTNEDSTIGMHRNNVHFNIPVTFYVFVNVFLQVNSMIISLLFYSKYYFN